MRLSGEAPTPAPPRLESRAEWPGCGTRFYTGVKRAVSSQDEARLLAFIAEALHKQVQRDAGVQAACAGLLRLGVSLVVKVEAVPGEVGPRVTVANRGAGVPKWTVEDEEILRSLGIDSDASNASSDPASEPGRRQPR